MAPIATSDLKPSLAHGILDPTVFPSLKSDDKLREVWFRHGDPHSPRFSNPRLTSVASLVEHNAAAQPSQPAFLYPRGDSFGILTWAEVHQSCCRASDYYAEQFRKQLDIANDTHQQPTFALLGTGSRIDYLITQIALNRLHVRTLLLSNKNSAETRDHLLGVCNAVGAIADEANITTLHGGRCGLPVADLIRLSQLYQRRDPDLESLAVFETNDEWNLQAMIIHSSGSTGVPKPIIHTNRSLCQIGRMYRLMPEYSIENWYLCFPLYIPHRRPLHRPVRHTKRPPHHPASRKLAPGTEFHPLCVENPLDDMGYPADCLHCAPSVIEDLAEYISLTTGDFAPLVRLKVLQPGGAPLSPATLARLQSLGVNVKTTYGTTETGPPLRTIPHTRDNPDVYRFRNLYPESPFVRMEAVGEAMETVEEAVWNVVGRVNEKTAACSSIPRQLMLVLERGEVLPVTPKGNVRRNIAWELFGGRVEELYARFLGTSEVASAHDNINDASTTNTATMGTIQRAVAEIFGLPVIDIDPERSWYEVGLDSLKAVNLRSRLVKTLGKFPLMFVFEYPIAKGLFEFLGRSDGANDTITSQRYEWILSTIQRMNSEIDSWTGNTVPRNNEREGHVIYLTGASGSLGNALLEALVQLPSVKTVYCAVRGPDPHARVADSPRKRGYPEHVYHSGKIRGVGYDMADENLGVDRETYAKLAGEVTMVMHNAWKLDFNQPKTFAFMSSVAAAMGSPAGTMVPESPLDSDPARALATGYAQSKFIVEQVTQHYAASLGVPVRILRVGQLCGHTRLGTWNRTEMWPMMMMTGLDFLAAMPVLDTEVDWLPVDVCAEAIREAVLGHREDSYRVTNLTNPATIPWNMLLDHLEEGSGKQFERVEMREWVARLETGSAGESGVEQTPAVKLLGFFQAMTDGGRSGEGVTFATGRREL
ncbi:Adenylate-forming reductase Nps11 [Colletotrichum trifolii]|uniref:Adenylate-forming reductase Nps11 n=1 Tax=Colletotrichum trifolii TaxID=5466 RepID=A0A4R8RGP2_COLTR|nr:Adenylate-forming reductase Nps11 [Colletotrichum trifolii]